MVQQTTSVTNNPFDHTVIVIDEAHNLVSRIVNKLKDKKSVYSKLYHLLMDAQDVRIITLSGTPVVNYPNEMAIMYNILRGYIKTWDFKVTVTTNSLVNQAAIEKWLETDTNAPIHDFVQYTNQQLTITRNPFGFVNSMAEPPRGPMKPQNQPKQQQSQQSQQIKNQCALLEDKKVFEYYFLNPLRTNRRDQKQSMIELIDNHC